MTPDFLTPGARRRRRWPLWLAGLILLGCAVGAALAALGGNEGPPPKPVARPAPKPPAPKPGRAPAPKPAGAEPGAEAGGDPTKAGPRSRLAALRQRAGADSPHARRQPEAAVPARLVAERRQVDRVPAGARRRPPVR